MRTFLQIMRPYHIYIYIYHQGPVGFLTASEIESLFKEAGYAALYEKRPLNQVSQVCAGMSKDLFLHMA